MQETPAGLLHQNFDKTDKLSDIELRSPISAVGGSFDDDPVQDIGIQGWAAAARGEI